MPITEPIKIHAPAIPDAHGLVVSVLYAYHRANKIYLLFLCLIFLLSLVLYAYHRANKIYCVLASLILVSLGGNIRKYLRKSRGISSGSADMLAAFGI